MRPIAILSTNNNPAYLFALPMVVQSWHIQGWDTEVICCSVPPPVIQLLEFYSPASANYTAVKNMNYSSVNKALFTQCVRLYWPVDKIAQNRYCVLGDADMFIGSSFLNRDFDKVNVFGHDLTGYSQIPMCYVGANIQNWKIIMGEQGMAQDLLQYAKPESNVFYESWGADQDILTGKLRRYGFSRINFINRGTDPANAGLPLGRLDRHNWQYPKTEVHDCHLLRPAYDEENYNKLYAMAQHIYKREDWAWLPAYYREFKKLLQL